MKKRVLGLMLVAAMSVSVLAGCSSKSSGDSNNSASSADEKASTTTNQKTITLRLANNHADSYPTSVACDEFAKLVSEKSDGRIKVETYHGAVLGEEKSVIEQVQVGGIDFARVSVSPLAEFDEQLNSLQLPYIYRSKEHMWNVLNSEVGDSLLASEGMLSKGIIGLNWFDGGSRNFYNSKKEVKTPDDLKGLKIRVQESSLMMGLVSALGADPTPMAFADVYSALQTGVIDGAENNWPSYISTSHYEVAKYITVDEHTRVPEMIIASKKTMESLSKEDQEIIMAAAKESTDIQRELWDSYEKDSEQAAIDSGATVTYLSDEEKSLFKDAVSQLNATEGAKYTDIITKIDSID